MVAPVHIAFCKFNKWPHFGTRSEHLCDEVGHWHEEKIVTLSELVAVIFEFIGCSLLTCWDFKLRLNMETPDTL